MLIFVFSALVTLLDQLFKQWVMRAIPLHETVDLIPGVIGLTQLHNHGAAFGIFSGMRWELVGIKVLCIFILIFILLRYNEGFFATLGLGAVLGGAAGNLIDRVLHGYVIDMFELQFINFAVFNIADIFITVGGITFVVFYIISSAKSAKKSGAETLKEDYEQDNRAGEEEVLAGVSAASSVTGEIEIPGDNALDIPSPEDDIKLPSFDFENADPLEDLAGSLAEEDIKLPSFDFESAEPLEGFGVSLAQEDIKLPSFDFESADPLEGIAGSLAEEENIKLPSFDFESADPAEGITAPSVMEELNLSGIDFESAESLEDVDMDALLREYGNDGYDNYDDYKNN